MKRSFLAPAKVNLYLQVLGKRPDGYHDLAMVMQRVDLCDSIDISVGGEPGVRVACDGVELSPGEENIAARAAARILHVVGKDPGVDISIEKRIPVAAGLGGGSSDAATVLMGLNEMLQAGLSRQALMAEGSLLGADVPFFIFKDTAWATGIGDRLEKIDSIPDLWYVLVNPGVAVSTAWVYGNLRLTSAGVANMLPRFPQMAEEIGVFLRNDLEAVTIGRHPVLGSIKRRLVEGGALGALMAGSGSTVFGVFDTEVAARGAAAIFSAEPGWRVFTVRPL